MRVLMRLRLTLFSFNAKSPQHEGRRLRTEAVEGKSPWIYKVVPILNSARVLNSLLHPLSVPAFQLRPSLNCSRRKTQSSTTATIKKIKLKKGRRTLTHLKSGFPTDNATSEAHPTPHLKESQNRPPTQRKIWTSST